MAYETHNFIKDIHLTYIKEKVAQTEEDELKTDEKRTSKRCEMQLNSPIYKLETR